MAHMLDSTKSGAVRMAYADREIPWHRLGTPMKGLQTCEAMLEAAHANFDVVTTKVAAVDVDGNFIRNPDGTPVIIDDSRATVRVNSDGSFDGLATVGTRYVVQQNKACLESAMAVVGASKGDAIVDTCGILHGGREFFASLDLGSLVIDPRGINDKIERYLLVRNGHDGRTPITFANTSRYGNGRSARSIEHFNRMGKVFCSSSRNNVVDRNAKCWTQLRQVPLSSFPTKARRNRASREKPL